LLFDISGLEEDAGQALLDKARRVACGVPGVRDAFIGDAIAGGKGYRHVLRIRFTSPAAAESFVEHPDWQAFRRKVLQPRLGESQSLTFRAADRVTAGAGTDQAALTFI